MKKIYIIAFLILCSLKGALADGIVPKITEIYEEYSTENSDVEKIAPTEAVVISNNGVAMYTGPLGSESKKDTMLEDYRFKKILVIPRNSTVTLTHKIEKNSEYQLKEEVFTSTLLWYYAEYGNKKGWIQYNDKNIQLYEEVKEVDKTPEEKEPVIVQPAPTTGEDKTPEEKEPTVVPTPNDDKTPEEKEPTTVQPKPDSDKPNPTHVQPDDNEAKNDTETIIICVLSSIVGALICLIIIMFTNRKSKKEE